MSEDHPNLVVLLTDQQSASMMSCTGNPHLETPGMDRLAENGTRFERAYCTNPVCVPSRTSLWTGRFPSEIGIRSNDFDHLDEVPERITGQGLGHCLREAGYETVYGGKEHLPEMTVEDLGFRRLTDDRREGLADACVAFLEADHDRPFCLVASFINPHDICYMAIRAYERHVGETADRGDVHRRLDAALELPEGADWADCCPPLPDNHEPQAEEPGAVHEFLDQGTFRRYVREEWTEADWRRHRWAYCRLTEMVDEHVRRIVDAIEAAGPSEETAVVFLSDHGDHDGSHRLEHKNIPYEEAARVPLVVDPPGESGDGRVDRDHLASVGLDLVPTLCEYAGVAPPEHCDGRSLRGLVEGDPPPDWREYLRVESEVGEAVVSDRYKYVRYDEGRHREQLYDLNADPGEIENVIGTAEAQSIVGDLRAHLSTGE
jgi:choline-sulfatase